MNDFGGKLRLARERRGLSLRQIAASTKISIAALEALERNDVSKLPGGVFSRAFVRSYAIEVSLDPDDTVHEFLDRFQGLPVVRAAAPAVISEEDSKFEIQRRVAAVALRLTLVAVPFVVALLYFTVRTRQAATAGETPATSGVTPPAVGASPQPVPLASTGAAAGHRAAVVTAPGTMTLDLHPTGNCWVRLTVDGHVVFAKLMAAGDTDVRQARDAIMIEVGDAGTFAFSIDGRRGRSLGQSGQVRTVRITRQSLSQYLEIPH